MGDPKRLLSELSDADGVERDLLGSLRHVDPPSDAKGVAWTRLSTQLAGIALVSTAGGSAAAAAKVAPTAFKLLSAKAIAGLAIAGAAVGASAVWVHYSSSPSSTAPKSSLPNAPVATAQVAVNAQQAAPEPSEPPAPEVAAALPAVSAPSALAPRSGASLSPKDRLAAESALLTQARAELRSGDASAAQQTLNKLRTSFPKGVLGQEREVLSIEVLSARGNAAAARKRAQAFIAAYPKSPHSAQLSRFADAP